MDEVINKIDPKGEGIGPFHLGGGKQKASLGWNDFLAGELEASESVNVVKTQNDGSNCGVKK
jgi:hypothetical protein